MIGRTHPFVAGIALLLAFGSGASANPQVVEPGYEIELFAEGLCQPVGIAYDSQWNFYIGTGGPTTWNRRRIQRIGVDGTIEWFGSTIMDPDPVVVDSQDNVYVGARKGGIYRISPDGATSVFAGRGQVIDGVRRTVLTNVDGLAVGPDDTIYAADNLANLYRIDQQANVELLATLSSRPAGIALAPDGSLYIGMRRRGTLDRWDPLAGSVSTVAQNLGFAIYPEVEPVTGDVFVSAVTYENGARSDSVIYRITTAGQVSLFARGFGVAEDMIFDGRGNLYVVDMTASCVYKISGLPSLILYDRTFVRCFPRSARCCRCHPRCRSFWHSACRMPPPWWSFVRPTRYRDSFDAPAAGEATVIILNGEEAGCHRVEVASIKLNGERIVGPRDLGRDVGHLEVPVVLRQGTNRIEVHLRGRPSTFLRVIVRWGRATPW